MYNFLFHVAVSSTKYVATYGINFDKGSFDKIDEFLATCQNYPNQVKHAFLLCSYSIREPTLTYL